LTSTIRIRRRNTGSPGAPTSLAAAEVAYNELDDTLYYGKGNNVGQATSILPVGGPGAFLKTSGIADIGRNKIHNALFNIQQRGAGPWTTGIVTADRWLQYVGSGDTISTSMYVLSDADRSQIGDEEALWTPGIQFTGAANATSQVTYYQNIEGVRRMAGKTVTLSFWVRAVSGTPKIGVAYAQNFGSSGSPSAPVTGNIGVTPALTGTFTRYTMTVALPSSAGKTLGTNGDDSLGIQLFLSCAPSNTNSVAAGGIGAQSGTVNLWGVQLEIGSQATPLEKLDPRNDLANCQRFYQIGQFYSGGYSGSSGVGMNASILFPVAMRASPTLAITSDVSGGALGARSLGLVTGGAVVTATSTGAGGCQFNVKYSASADL
jgi:hypothetical protein